MNSIAVMGGRRVMPRPRGIHSSGLSFAVGGKLMKFALSAQARGGGERERERKAVAGKHVLSRVGEPLWSMCRHCTTYVYICMEIIATSAKYIPPNVPSRYSIPGEGRGGHLDLPKHFKSYRSGDRSYNNQPFEDWGYFYGWIRDLISEESEEIRSLFGWKW